MDSRIKRSPLVVNVQSGDPYDIYVGRDSNTPYGNPFRVGKAQNRTQIILKYRNWVLQQPELIQKIKAELHGKILACWCRPKLCHADILAEIANE